MSQRGRNSYKSNLIFCNHDVYLKKKQDLNEVPKKSNRIVEIQQTYINTQEWEFLSNNKLDPTKKIGDILIHY